MMLTQIFRRLLRRWLTTGLGALFFVYFSFHMINGDRGVLSYFKLHQEIHEASIKHASVRTEREKLEHRVKALRTDSLDLEMLDQQLRVMLNMGRSDERVILLDQSK